MNLDFSMMDPGDIPAGKRSREPYEWSRAKIPRAEFRATRDAHAASLTTGDELIMHHSNAAMAAVEAGFGEQAVMHHLTAAKLHRRAGHTEAAALHQKAAQMHFKEYKAFRVGGTTYSSTVGRQLHDVADDAGEDSGHLAYKQALDASRDADALAHHRGVTTLLYRHGHTDAANAITAALHQAERGKHEKAAAKHLQVVKAITQHQRNIRAPLQGNMAHVAAAHQEAADMHTTAHEVMQHRKEHGIPMSHEHKGKILTYKAAQISDRVGPPDENDGWTPTPADVTTHMHQGHNPGEHHLAMMWIHSQGDHASDAIAANNHRRAAEHHLGREVTLPEAEAAYNRINDF